MRASPRRRPRRPRACSRRRTRPGARTAAAASGVEQLVAPVDRRAQRLLALGQVAGAAAQQLERQERRGAPCGACSRVRAAASSIASGRPSSRRQISDDLLRLFARAPEGAEPRAAARMAKSASRVAERQAAGTRYSCSPRGGAACGSSRAERGSGADVSSAARSGAASTTCSKLSSTSSEGAPRRSDVGARSVCSSRSDRSWRSPARRARDREAARGRRSRRRRRRRPPSACAACEREPRLAGPARPGERDEPGAAAQEGADLVELAPAADERGLCAREMAAHAELGGLHPQRRVLAEDRLLELLELGIRLEPELLVERLAQPAEGGERRRSGGRCGTGRASAGRAGARAAGCSGTSASSSGTSSRVAAEREVGLDPLFERGEPQSLRAARSRSGRRPRRRRRRAPARATGRARCGRSSLLRPLRLRRARSARARTAPRTARGRARPDPRAAGIQARRCRCAPGRGVS